ncbi:DUF3307 domain-containing protein [Bowmanella dokdonensis]|uniref:DUF3307 domain-containing protein n=1 Tax=Bowmanella dokdonensis TaxID=751969 RepID=A0A939DQL4_9ALTE|nr:DUF3307 domain-containing protein [Bowmanella dokdonensis]MBN7826985.1 DUF3307 domain-containing protein [Bowmanella dokdonensis]
MHEGILLAAVLVSHLLADFFLQPISWIEDRLAYHYRSTKLLYHTSVHGLLSFATLWLWEGLLGWGWSIWQPLLLAGLIALLHYLTDLAKSYCPRTTRYFLIDQVLHLLVLVWVWLYVTNSWPLLNDLWPTLFHLNNWIILTAYLLVMRPVSVLIANLLKHWGAQASADSSPSTGHAIGVVERVLILTLILLQQYASVGFVLAAKSIFRFGDLTRQADRKMTEYVMLGTLLSVTLTLIIGLLCSALLSR